MIHYQALWFNYSWIWLSLLQTFKVATTTCFQHILEQRNEQQGWAYVTSQKNSLIIACSNRNKLM